MGYRKSNKKIRGWSKDNPRKQEIKTNIKSRRPSHVTVVPKNGEHPERMVKRFLKRCKKIKIIEEYRKKEYFEKPSAKKRRMKLRREARIKKDALQNKE